MRGRWSSTTDGEDYRFFSPEQVNKILSEGARRGRAGSHAAIERILKLEPGIQRADLWQRIRQLKFPSNGPQSCRRIWSAEDDQILSAGYEKGWSGKQEAIRELLKRHPDWRPHVIWKRAAKLHLIQKVSKRWQDRSQSVWSERDNQLLLNLAGYKTPRAIARMLHRSEAAVRYHLMLLGKSSRVHLEGFSRQGLATDLHLGKKTVQRLIVEGLLEVRDPRITRESLDSLCRLGGTQHQATRASDTPPTRNGERSVSPIGGTSAKSSRAERVWAEVASSFGVPVSTIKSLIAHRVLKLYDPTITEKSLRDFCRRYGSLVNYEFLNRETREWLESSMDLVSILWRVCRTAPDAAPQARPYRQAVQKMRSRDPRECLLQSYQEMWVEAFGEHRPTERGTGPDLMYCAAACFQWRREGYGGTGRRVHSCFQREAYVCILTCQGCERTCSRRLLSQPSCLACDRK